MASLPTLIPLAADVDHVASYKALISRRSQRGRQLQDYFDQIISQFRARDDFLMAHVKLLQTTLHDHGIPIPTTRRRATAPLENVSVGQQENDIITVEDGQPSSFTTHSENSGERARVNRKRSSSESLPSPKRTELSRLSPRAEESSSSSSLSSPSVSRPKANHRLRKHSSARGSKQRRHVARVHSNNSLTPDQVSDMSELPSSDARTSPLESAANVASEGSVRIKREATEDDYGGMSQDNNSQRADDESVLHHQSEFEVFGDPLLEPSYTATVSQRDETSSCGVSELDEPENLDPQHAVGDDLEESRSVASLGASDYEWIHPGLLQTFYDAGPDCRARSRYDADYEASDVDEENGSLANDTEVHDTEANDTDVATEVKVKVEEEESFGGSLSPREEVRVKVEKEESLGGSLSPSEIARLAPADRAQTNGFVRGWAQGVARAAAAFEADAGPVVGVKLEFSPDQYFLAQDT